MATSFNDFPPLPRPVIAPGETPPPGSWEAMEQGCTCPMDDNEFGAGYYGQAGEYCLTEGCPLHHEMYLKARMENLKEMADDGLLLPGPLLEEVAKWVPRTTPIRLHDTDAPKSQPSE